jgi:hypothetical protein
MFGKPPNMVMNLSFFEITNLLIELLQSFVGFHSCFWNAWQTIKYLMKFSFLRHQIFQLNLAMLYWEFINPKKFIFLETSNFCQLNLEIHSRDLFFRLGI